VVASSNLVVDHHKHLETQVAASSSAYRENQNWVLVQNTLEEVPYVKELVHRHHEQDQQALQVQQEQQQQLQQQLLRGLLRALHHHLPLHQPLLFALFQVVEPLAVTLHLHRVQARVLTRVYLPENPHPLQLHYEILLHHQE